MTIKKTLWASALLLFLLDFGSARGQSTAPMAGQKAIFAGGCFWCMQPPFDHTPGVKSTRVGYTGGTELNPTYVQVSSGETAHREAIEVAFDPAKVTYAQLLTVFWQNINPIQRDGQFHDIGNQYTSAIFYLDEAQHQAAEISKDALGKSARFQNPIATAVLPATQFWPAEDYHQKYYLKNRMAYGMYYFASGRAAFRQKHWDSGSR